MSSKHILVVDDNMAIRTILKTRLEAEGYLVTEASTGQEGLDALSADHFSAVILDLKMPEMDGIAFLNHPSFRKHLPKPHVVVYTSAEFDYTRSESLKLGVDAYFNKTDTDESQLVDHLNHLLIDTSHSDQAQEREA
jgi:CheY-like chemotaxis protein